MVAKVSYQKKIPNQPSYCANSGDNLILGYRFPSHGEEGERQAGLLTPGSSSDDTFPTH
jgi:hypothetical protein